jgi:hypothetical protein
VNCSGLGAIAEGSLVWRSDKNLELQTGLWIRIEAGPKPGTEGGNATIRVDSASAACDVYGGILGGLGLGASRPKA